MKEELKKRLDSEQIKKFLELSGCSIQELRLIEDSMFIMDMDSFMEKVNKVSYLNRICISDLLREFGLINAINWIDYVQFNKDNIPQLIKVREVPADVMSVGDMLSCASEKEEEDEEEYCQDRLVELKQRIGELNADEKEEFMRLEKEFMDYSMKFFEKIVNNGFGNK